MTNIRKKNYQPFSNDLSTYDNFFQSKNNCIPQINKHNHAYRQPINHGVTMLTLATPFLRAVSLTLAPEPMV